MKFGRLVALLLVLCMLTACTAPAQPTEPPELSNDPVTPTADEPTPPTDVPVEPNEPNEPDEPDLSWFPAGTEKMGYDDYFAEDRPYEHSSFWLVETDGVTKAYTLQQSEAGLQVCTYDANPWDDVGSEAIYTVPNSESLLEYAMLGTDGVEACFVARNDGTATIYLVDLGTGRQKIIIQDAIIKGVSYCGDVLYYAVYQDDQMQIVRHYIPTGDELFYPTGQTLAPMFVFWAPTSSNGPLTWECTTEKMTAAVMKELQNPESAYRNNERVPPYLWEMEEPWIYADRNPVHWLCMALQENTGARTLYKRTVQADGSMISEATGVVDSCWYGSDYGHDHYNPDASAPAKPKANIGAWMPFAEQMRPEGEESLVYHLKIYRNQLYQTDGNVFTLLTDTALKDYYITEAEYGGFINAYYGVTVDNQLVRIYLDGTEPTVLYQGKDDIWQLSYAGSKIYIGDGDTIVELDLQTQQWRTVFSHEDRFWFYCDYEDENMLYIDFVRGLHVAAYLYDLATGEFTEVGYRL